MEHLSLSAEKIWYWGPLPITNSLIATWIVGGALIIFALYLRFSLRLIPLKIQNLTEIIVEGFYQLVQKTLGPRADYFFPLIFTFFIYITFLNWFGLIPGVGTIGIYKTIYEEGHLKETFVPLLRGGSADLNTTLALALISVILTQIWGFKTLGWRNHLQKYFNFKSFIRFFTGILELVSELARIISFAFRLFGNIFAGEVLLAVVASLVPLFAPLPFLGLEIFVGVVQALVFSMLTAVFIKMATSHH